ncbi:MAG: hypothetical protein WC405_03910 [Syntrophales bacterium]
MNKTDLLKEIKNKAEEVINSGNQDYILATLPKVYDLFISAFVLFSDSSPIDNSSCHSSDRRLDHDYFLRLLDLAINYHSQSDSTVNPVFAKHVKNLTATLKN